MGLIRTCSFVWMVYGSQLFLWVFLLTLNPVYCQPSDMLRTLPLHQGVLYDEECDVVTFADFDWNEEGRRGPGRGPHVLMLSMDL